MSAGVATYRDGDSRLHALHPTTKVLLVACFVFGGYLAGVELRVALVAVLIAGAAAAGVAGVVLTTAAPMLLPLLAGLLVIRGIVVGDGTAVLELGPITVWRAGLLSGAAFFSILAVFVLAGVLFVTVTHPKKLAVALSEAGVPYRVGYVLVTALQLVPDLRQRAGAILDSQRARGLDTGGGLRARIRALRALLSPLLIGALISAQTRSLALEARGFSLPGPRSSLYTLTVDRSDHVARLAGIGGVLVLGGVRLL